MKRAKKWCEHLDKNHKEPVTHVCLRFPEEPYFLCKACAKEHRQLHARDEIRGGVITLRQWRAQ